MLLIQHCHIDTRTVRCFYVNFGGMRSKLPKLYAALATTNYNVVIITESWLINGIENSEFTPPGWLPFRRDRHSNGTAFGGGVLNLVRCELNSTQVDTTTYDAELVWVKWSKILCRRWICPNRFTQ